MPKLKNFNVSNEYIMKNNYSINSDIQYINKNDNFIPITLFIYKT